ncbi:hypothetical protein WJX74_004796 [Apatococcus lobatus]|uniref:Uncharacterized protein n=1 Tax=Apatococcus lobatus TaxID=904363 RepID=A0AAW1QD05_9CHLO
MLLLSTASKQHSASNPRRSFQLTAEHILPSQSCCSQLPTLRYLPLRLSKAAWPHNTEKKIARSSALYRSLPGAVLGTKELVHIDVAAAASLPVQMTASHLNLDTSRFVTPAGTQPVSKGQVAASARTDPPSACFTCALDQAPESSNCGDYACPQLPTPRTIGTCTHAIITMSVWLGCVRAFRWRFSSFSTNKPGIKLLCLSIAVLAAIRSAGFALADYTDSDILSVPQEDSSPGAVATNFANYPTVPYDPVAFGQRYQGSILPYAGLSSQPYDYQYEPLPTLASGFSFNAYAPFNVQISTYWATRLGISNVARMWKEDVGIAIWDTASGIDMLVKVTDVADDLAINDIRIEPSVLRSVQGYTGADPVPAVSSCLWYFTKTWSIAPRPRFQTGPQQLPVLQPALINSLAWMYQATEAQWNNNIAYLKSQNWPGVANMKYGMIGSQDPSIVNTNTPPDINNPRITRAQVLANAASYGTLG